jgi:quinol monooxygenase YgiN
MAVIALLDIQLKADAQETGLGVLHETLAATRAFPGCVSISVLSDSADPAHVVVHETWESIEADEAYRKWRTTDEGRSNLGSVLAGAPKLTKFTVAEGV